MESRVHPRQRVLKEGKVVIGLSTVIDVKVRDLSKGGARLMLPALTRLPSTFQLSIGLALNPRPVQLCWQSANQAGVAFADKDAGEAPMPPTASASDMHCPVDSAFTPVDRPGDGTALLTLEYRLSRIFPTPRSEVGHCAIDLRIRSQSSMDAEQPFLALPQLGPEVVAAENWAAREIVAVRKLIRVARIDGHPLSPSSTTHCCTLCMPYTEENGGHMTFARGIAHSLANLPDFRLNCQIGAANFPTEQCTLHIPAKDIARAIRQ